MHIVHDLKHFKEMTQLGPKVILEKSNEKQIREDSAPFLLLKFSGGRDLLITQTLGVHAS